MSGSGGQQQNLPTLAPQNSQHQMNNHNLMSLQSSQAPQQGNVSAAENYGGRAPPTPNYYPSSSTPQQSSFPAFAQQSPTQHSPNTSSAPPTASPPSRPTIHIPWARPKAIRLVLPSHITISPPLPHLLCRIFTNLVVKMALLGGMGSMAYPQQMSGPIYGGHHPQQMPHKRSHSLAAIAKKSFSRKDALKRHILVKGCGTKPTNGTTNPNGDSQSPIDKSEMMSDSTNDDSPEMIKKELSQ
ncbi:hypothetical protein DID88_005621 [Monilinia fructigena]|uniref:C2H2-type domain-containing protein n=1 Tax=Monilinia fructigena TaxID=38457 RepID=A0A395J0C7_9HELO|nr:hypothetical protein DID88_005621 [Monilinia fructigena]